ncbi:MAG: hypothetical protein NC310_01970 [Roseburia sp.]|nr:hypothetical protein [Roseburia sp.]MCM1556292.1 hypothetical protein [Anaeroplasma bactoclasticum]
MRNVLVKKIKTSKGFTYQYTYLGYDNDVDVLRLIEQDIENVSNEIKALNPVVNSQRKLREELKKLKDLRDLILKDIESDSKK